MIGTQRLSQAVMLAGASLLASSFATAGQAISLSAPTTTENTETRVFAGARWTLGGSLKPELLAGVRSAQVDSTGDVEGLQTSISYDLASMGLGKLRFEALKGNQTTQATFGVGYDFGYGTPLLGLGARGNHLFGGVDLLWGPNVPEFYLGLDTLESLDKPAPTCDAGTYDPAIESCVSQPVFR